MATSGNVAAGLPNRGKTYHGGTPSSIGRSVDLEGTEAYFKDEIPQTAMAPALKRSGRTVSAKLVRNSSGIALTPGRLVSWETGRRGTRVDGYTTTTNAEIAGVVDPDLPAAGVADDDLFWIIIKGPCLVKSALGGAAVTAGSVVGALTAATSQATTAGRIVDVTATTGDTILNKLGRAMSAKTTAETNEDTLIDVFLLN